MGTFGISSNSAPISGDHSRTLASHESDGMKSPVPAVIERTPSTTFLLRIWAGLPHGLRLTADIRAMRIVKCIAVVKPATPRQLRGRYAILFARRVTSLCGRQQHALAEMINSFAWSVISAGVFSDSIRFRKIT